MLFYFKKSAAEAHRILVETTCRNWFRCFKNNHFDVEDKERFSAPKNVWRRRIDGITSWRVLSGVSWTCRIITSWSHNSFETFESIRNGSKARTLGVVRVEAERRRTAFRHAGTAASTAEKERFFCIVSWPVMKGEYTTIAQKVEDHKVSLAMHQHRRQSQISMVRSFCSALYGISWAQFIMSCSNRSKPPREIAIDYNWYVWAEHWKKNGHCTSRDTTKGLCNMWTLEHMLQNGWKSTWKRLDKKSYLKRRIHQRLPRLIISWSDRWQMAWMSSTFILMKMPKNGLIRC